jgi:hypothetical protein
MSAERLKFVCACAVADGLPRRSLYVALVVGTLLNLINQGDAILGSAPVNWLKVGLTYLVPYVVCTYGAVAHQLRNFAAGDRRRTTPAAGFGD